MSFNVTYPMMKFREWRQEGDKFFIPLYNSNDECSFTWFENESWEDMIKREEWIFHASFVDFIGVDFSDKSMERFDFPNSVIVYDCKSHFIVSTSDMPDLEDLIAFPKNIWAYIEFFKEYCLPFVKSKEAFLTFSS